MSVRQLSVLLGFWLGFLVFVVSVAQVIPYRPDFAFTRLDFYEPALVNKLPEQLTAFAGFDGVYYLNKAAYSLWLEQRFMPLYPALIWLFSGSFLSDQMTVAHLLAGLSISYGALFLSLWLLYRLVADDFSPETAHWSVLLLLAFPTAFFFGALYTESLFLCLVVALFWSLKKRWWLASFVIVGLAGITRLPGILLIFPAIFHWWKQQQESRQLGHSLAFFVTAGAYSLVAFLPLLILMGVLWFRAGDPLLFVHAHGELANSRSTSQLVFPLITVWRYGGILTSLSPLVYEWWVALLELASVGLVVVGGWYLFVRKFPPQYVVATIALVALPLLSGTFSGFPRYVLVVFPLFIVLAHAPLFLRKLLLVLFLVLQAILLGYFARGYFVA